LEQTKRKGIIMRARDGADFRWRFLGKAKSQINEYHVAANRDDVVSEGAQHLRQRTLNAPRQFAREAKHAQPKPHGPMLRKPQTGLFAGAAHARITASTPCGKAAGSTR